MKDKNSRNDVITIIRNIIKADEKKIFPVFQSQLLDTGMLSITEVSDILSFKINLEDLAVEVLIWIYSALQKYNKALPPLHKFFTEDELQQSKVFRVERVESKFPLRFKGYSRLTRKDEFLIVLPVAELNEMQKAGVIQIDSRMSRDGRITNYHGQLITNIRYNDTRAREIGDLVASSNFYANAIRLHLVVDGTEDYQIKESEIVINSGNLVLLEGNHRMKGFEYALSQNSNLYYNIPVILTIGNVNMGQSIIYQEEKREPLDKEHVATYKNSPARDIVNAIKNSPDLDRVYKFCDTKQAITEGAGFILESILAKYIEIYYATHSISKVQEKNITNWLIEFLNVLADIMMDDFSKYYQIRKTRWSVSPYAWAGYILLSKALQNQDNWENKLRKILASISFDGSDRPWGNVKNPDKVVEKYFTGVVDNVSG